MCLLFSFKKSFLKKKYSNITDNRVDNKTVIKTDKFNSTKNIRSKNTSVNLKTPTVDSINICLDLSRLMFKTPLDIT